MTHATDHSSRARRLTLGALGALGAAAALTLAVPTAASAHVGVDPSTTAAGSSSVLTFSIGHGCEGSPTTSLTFEIPDEIVSVRPTVHAGWSIDTVTDGDRISSVVYTAETPLDDGYRDTVQLQVGLPEDAEGETIAFPVVQACEVGETAWTEIAQGDEDPHSLDAPAPTVTVTAAEAADGHGGHGEAAEAHDSSDPATDDGTAATASSASPVDPLARGFGIAGSILGLASVALLVVLILRRGAPSADDNAKG